VQVYSSDRSVEPITFNRSTANWL